MIGKNNFITKCIANDIAEVRVNSLANVIAKDRVNGIANGLVNALTNPSYAMAKLMTSQCRIKSLI